MDRYLVLGTLSLLIVQISFLLNSLGLIHIYDWQKDKAVTRQKAIGQLTYKTREVKRKSVNSIIWQNSKNNEDLFLYDSVLTLDSSRAELNLEGDIKVKIFENTLVVLDPVNENKNSLRLKFQKGFINAHTKTQKLRIGQGSWSLEAHSGSELSIKSLENKKIAVEVKQGTVSLKNKNSEEVQTLSDANFILDQNEVSSVKAINKSLSFINPPKNRIYTHDKLTAVPLQWNNKITGLSIVHPTGFTEKLNTNKKTAILSLKHGVYGIALLGLSGDISPTHTLEILPAPKIKYMHPLPRDRVTTRQKEIFSWLSSPDIIQHELVFQNSKQDQKITTQNYIEWSPSKSSKEQWSVYGYDKDGYQIPPYYSIPVYFIDEALSAPVLNSPQNLRRQPASEETPDQSYLNKFFDLLLPTAHADTKQGIVFTWQTVNEADHYTIEISSDKGFLKPELIKTVALGKYIWNSYLNKKYYWRVAAGKSNGQMGFFSEPAEFDVRKLSSQVQAQGMPYFEDVKISKPKRTATYKQSPDPSLTNKEITREKEAPKKNKWTGNLYLQLGFDYAILEQNSDELRKVSYDGLVAPTFFLQKDLNTNSYISIDLKHFDWSPSDSSDLPFQDDISTLTQNYKIKWNWLPLQFKTFPLIKRTGLESVDSEDALLAGAFVKIGLSQSLDLLGSLNYGSSDNFKNLILGDLKLQHHHIISEKYYLKSRLEIGVLSGDKNIETKWLQLGTQIGFKW